MINKIIIDVGIDLKPKIKVVKFLYVFNNKVCMPIENVFWLILHVYSYIGQLSLDYTLIMKIAIITNAFIASS